MPRLKMLKPKVQTLDTRLKHRDLPRGLTPDQAYNRVRRQESRTQALYGTARWKKLRAEQLTQHPLCRMCTELDGRAVAATVCDHVIPCGNDMTAFWAGPFQSLCGHHHSAVKQREDAAARIG